MYHDPSWLITAGRLLIVASFLIAGIRNMTRARIEDHIARMIVAKTPKPREVFWTGIVMQFTGCALLLFDWHADVGIWLRSLVLEELSKRKQSIQRQSQSMQ